MPLQSSGQISVSNIVGEILGISPAVDSNQSLATLSAAANNSDPCNTGSLPGSNAAPHAMSEFYNYDHNCTTSGPSLIQCNIVGPFGDSGEACALAAEFCETDQGFVVWTDGASCCPELTNIYYTDSNGTLLLAGGWYATCDCPTLYVFNVDDSGSVFDIRTCGK